MSNAAKGFAGLKNRRTNYDELAKKFETKSGAGRSDDDRFYYPERDSSGNGYALIRFLPTTDDAEAPFVEYFNHSFKGPTGKWFWDKCRTSIGEECPVCQNNRQIVNDHGGDWAAVPPNVQNLVRQRSRKRQFVSNVYVVKDPETPENEGKVFLFKYGTKIMDKIKEAINPSFAGDAPIDPFNPWQGANFALKIRKVKGQTNYDASAFESQAPLFDNDEDIMAVAGMLIPLTEFTDPDNYTPEETQAQRLAAALGTDKPPVRLVDEPVEEADEPEQKKVEEKPASKWTAPKVDSSEEDMDELFEDIPF